MENREKLVDPTIEFTTVTFLGGGMGSNCGLTEEQKEEYEDDEIVGSDAVYNGGIPGSGNQGN